MDISFGLIFPIITSFGDDINNLGDYVWFANNSGDTKIDAQDIREK